MEMNVVDKLAYVLVVIGGLNWGLVGWFNYNFVSSAFGTSVARVVFAIIGVAALYMLYAMVKMMSSSKKK